jgi:hypothetical protein
MVPQVRYSVPGRLRGRVAPCVVCTVHMEMRRAGFLIQSHNQGRRFVSGLASKPLRWFLIDLVLKTDAMVCEWFGLKTTRTVFTGLASKPVATVFSNFASKLVATGSPSLASKPVVGFLVQPQNQGGGGFLGMGLKTSSYSLVICASKSPRQFLGLGLKTKRASVCWLHHKTDGGRSARDMHRDLAACFTWKQVWLVFHNLA